MRICAVQIHIRAAHTGVQAATGAHECCSQPLEVRAEGQPRGAHTALQLENCKIPSGGAPPCKHDVQLWSMRISSSSARLLAHNARCFVLKTKKGNHFPYDNICRSRGAFPSVVKMIPTLPVSLQRSNASYHSPHGRHLLLAGRRRNCGHVGVRSSHSCEHTGFLTASASVS